MQEMNRHLTKQYFLLLAKLWRVATEPDRMMECDCEGRLQIIRVASCEVLFHQMMDKLIKMLQISILSNKYFSAAFTSFLFNCKNRVH